MRSVPHRVVCLLGLDDGAFPRNSVRDGDDVLARDPWIGERDPRSEDRQLLLDAVCAAEEHLVIVYSGADERTGATIPPAVPLGELLDAFDRTATVPDGRRVRDAITTRHPLQPFDARNFVAGRAGHRRARSASTGSPSQGAEAAAQPRTQPPPFLSDARWNPCRSRTSSSPTCSGSSPTRRGSSSASGSTSTTPGPRTSPTTRCRSSSTGSSAGASRTGCSPSGWPASTATTPSPPSCTAASCRPASSDIAVLQDIDAKVDALLVAAAAELTVEPESYDIDLDLGDGTRLTGTVAGVRGDVLLTLTPSSLSAKHRLAAWIDLLALTAAHPGREWRATTIGKDAWSSKLGPISPRRPP